MNYYNRAKELAEETVAHRRYMHKNAEAGLDLPKTKAYVMEQLRECGIEPTRLWLRCNGYSWKRR